MTSELKPCPFCGGSRAAITSECDIDTEGKFYRVECLDCRAKTKERYAMETCPIFYESVRNDWNTRATPSSDTMDGLVRYGQVMTRMMKVDNGDYVLYDEAAAVVAAKDGEIDKLKDGGHKSFKSAIGWQERAKAAEAELDKHIAARQSYADLFDGDVGSIHENIRRLKAELAQIKAQDPVAWMHPDARWTDVSKQEVAVHCKVGTYPLPLYASPVSDSLKAENERLREALRDIRSDCQSPIDFYERNGPEFTSPYGSEYQSSSSVMDKFAELVASIDTALKGDSNDKG